MPLGIGGVVVLLVGSWLTGVNLFDVVGGGGGVEPMWSPSAQPHRRRKKRSWSTSSMR